MRSFGYFCTILYCISKAYTQTWNLRFVEISTFMEIMWMLEHPNVLQLWFGETSVSRKVNNLDEDFHQNITTALICN